MLATLTLLIALSADVDTNAWTTRNTLLEGALVLATLTDITTTRWMQQYDPKYKEANPLLGINPSAYRLYGVCCGLVMTHAVIAYLLPAKWREAWQGIWIGVEVTQSYNNYLWEKYKYKQVGLKISF